MRTTRTAGIVLVATLLCGALALAACGASTGSTDPATPTEEPSQEVQASPTQTAQEPQDDLGAWMTGTWKVKFKLRSVTPGTDWARQAADQPSAKWSCRVKGSQMVIDAGLHVYTGKFSVPEGSGDEWLYDGESTWVDEGGVTWTSHIVVEGRRKGDDAFTADQGGEISSDSDGTLHTAEWDAAGTRVP